MDRFYLNNLVFCINEIILEFFTIFKGCFSNIKKSINVSFLDILINFKQSNDLSQKRNVSYAFVHWTWKKHKKFSNKISETDCNEWLIVKKSSLSVRSRQYPTTPTVTRAKSSFEIFEMKNKYMNWSAFKKS